MRVVRFAHAPRPGRDIDQHAPVFDLDRIGRHPVLLESGLPDTAAAMEFPIGRVEDGRGRLGHSATPRFPSPLIEPDVPISGIRLSDWLHSKAHGTTHGSQASGARCVSSFALQYSFL